MCDFDRVRGEGVPLGTSRQLMTFLKSLTWGKYHFEILTHVVRAFLGSENHFLQLLFMRSGWTKNISKNTFLKSSLEFVSIHFQAN